MLQNPILYKAGEFMQEQEMLDEGVFEDLLDYGVKRILDDEDPDAFLAWMQNVVPLILPELVQPFAEAQVQQNFLLMLGRAIWNATPLPSNHFRPRPLPVPGRNDPCFCGSGRKYKQCCGPQQLAELGLEPEFMLTLVLDHLPVKSLADLPFAYLPPEALGMIAQDWIRDGEAARAVKMLEAYFAQVSKPDARAEMCLDALLDAYSALHRPRKKQALLDTMRLSPVQALRVTAMQRQCLMAIDEHDFARAWSLFHDVQREDPDHPLLANLEIMLLLEEGRAGEASQRARFWLARLRRRQDEINPGLLEFLEQISQDPHGAFLEMHDRETPGLKQLEQIIARVQRPADTAYVIRKYGDEWQWDMKREVDALLNRWERVFPLANVADFTGDPLMLVDETWDEDTSEHWLAFLERTPEALNTLEILAGLLQAIDDLAQGSASWFEAKLRLPLLTHAYAIIDQTLLQSGAQQTRLSWYVRENRFPLSLIAELIVTYTRTQQWREALPLLERMVYTLNPDDNQGLRELLSSAYLYCYQPEKVIALRQQFSEDVLAGPVYNQVLALYILGRQEEAAAALAQARKDLPQVYKFLCAKTVKPPKLMPGFIGYGGKDQAWYYREGNLALWQKANALPWLCASGAKKRAGARKAADE